MRSFSSELQKVADAERQMQLMMRAIVSGVISERDRILQYTTGEFFQELSLYIQEIDIKNKEMEKAFKK